MIRQAADGQPASLLTRSWRLSGGIVQLLHAPPTCAHKQWQRTLHVQPDGGTACMRALAGLHRVCPGTSPRSWASSTMHAVNFMLTHLICAKLAPRAGELALLLMPSRSCCGANQPCTTLSVIWHASPSGPATCLSPLSQAGNGAIVISSRAAHKRVGSPPYTTSCGRDQWPACALRCRARCAPLRPAACNAPNSLGASRSELPVRIGAQQRTPWWSCRPCSPS